MVFLDTTNRIVPDPKVPCTLRLEYPEGSPWPSSSNLPATIKIHGASSQGFPKKSFSFSLEIPRALAGMRTNSHWILNAAYIDRSLMRHKLSYDLFLSLSTREQPRRAAASRFVEVILNGKYHGVYLLMERVDRQLLGLSPYRTNDFRHACIYKAVDHAANFSRAGHDGYEQREPDPEVQSYWEPLDRFNQFVATAPNTNFFGGTKGIAARLDLENAIDFHLLVLVTCNSDGITKNYILARNGQERGPEVNQRFFFAPWDYDGTFGRNWDIRPYPATVWLSNHLFERLLGNAAYRRKFVARWNQLRQHEFATKTIQDMMEANVRVLGEAARRNTLRWPTNRGPYPDRITLEEDVEQMKAWLEMRLTWLDQRIGKTQQ